MNFKKFFFIFCFNIVLLGGVSLNSNATVVKDNNNENYDNKKKEKTVFLKQEKNNYRHFGIIISGPSGVGKTTLIEELAKKHPELHVSISATTRQKRKGEADGKSYYFFDKKKFRKLIDKGEFLEYAKNYGNYYGSLKKNYTESIKNKKDVVFVLSVKGMQNAIKNKEMDFITIFIKTSSEQTLLSRLKSRATETAEQIKKRFKNVQHELSFAKKYDYVVYNDDFTNAVKTIEAIYLAEKFKRIK